MATAAQLVHGPATAQRVPDKTHSVQDPGFTPTPARPYPIPATHGNCLGALSKGCNQASSQVTLTLTTARVALDSVFVFPHCQ